MIEEQAMSVLYGEDEDKEEGGGGNIAAVVIVIIIYLLGTNFHTPIDFLDLDL